VVEQKEIRLNVLGRDLHLAVPQSFTPNGERLWYKNRSEKNWQ
jgi:hypothetical protein